MADTLVILAAHHDNRDALLMTQAFQSVGILDTLKIVKDGQEAMDYMAGTGQYSDRNLHPAPDFAFFDSRLPGKSGLELLEWMRRQLQLQQVPVMILSSCADEKDKKRASDLGAAYLVKPDNVEELGRELKRFHAFWWPSIQARKSRGTENRGRTP